MDCRTDKSCSLKKKLGFKLHDVINTKEQTINSIKDSLKEKIYKLNIVFQAIPLILYFNEYKLAIEVDELGHTNRNINNETERQKALEKERNCVFIRINPDEKDFNIFKEINKIYRHIKKSFKKFLRDKILKKSVRIKI